MANVMATLGSTAYNLLFNGLSLVVLVFLVVAAGFGWHYWKKWRMRKKSYKQLSALIIKKDGTWFTDQLGYFSHADKIDKLHMKGTGHTLPVLPSTCVRAKQCILFNYAPKQYAAIPCSMWDNIDLKKFKIEIVNLQMKNFVYLEQRAAVSRWAYIKDLMVKLAPWITFVLVGATVCVCVWLLMKFGLDMWSQIVAARTIDCQSLLPQLQPSLPIPTP